MNGCFCFDPFDSNSTVRALNWAKSTRQSRSFELCIKTIIVGTKKFSLCVDIFIPVYFFERVSDDACTTMMLISKIRHLVSQLVQRLLRCIVWVGETKRVVLRQEGYTGCYWEVNNVSKLVYLVTLCVPFFDLRHTSSAAISRFSGKIYMKTSHAPDQSTTGATYLAG